MADEDDIPGYFIIALGTRNRRLGTATQLPEDSGQGSGDLVPRDPFRLGKPEPISQLLFVTAKSFGFRDPFRDTVQLGADQAVAQRGRVREVAGVEG